MTFEEFNNLCKNYQIDLQHMTPCRWGVYSDYYHAEKGLALSNKLEAERKQQQSSTILDSVVFVFIIGLFVIFSAVAFAKNKKWGIIALIVFNFFALLYTAFFTYVFLFFVGLSLHLFLFVLVLVLLISEVSFIKNHWLELH